MGLAMPSKSPKTLVIKVDDGPEHAISYIKNIAVDGSADAGKTAKIQIVGAMYDLNTGMVQFVS